MISGGVDTATLRVTVDGRAAQSEAERTEKSLDKLGKTGMNVQKAMYSLGVMLSAGMVFRKFIQETSQSQHVLAQLEARLVSTGGAAGKTMQDLTAMSNALQKTTIYSNEAVEGAQGLLLTFKKIRGDEFDRATKATLDLATAMGTDLKSAALQLGKALEDPVGQMTALSRSGVSFSQAQKDMIKAMVEANDVAGAQNMILREMETQFGGAAEAARNTLGGALAYLKNQWDDLFKAQASTTEGMVSVINALGGALGWLGDKLNKFVGGIQIMAVDMAVFWGKLKVINLEIENFFRRGKVQAELDAARQSLAHLRTAAEEVRMEIINGTPAAKGYAAAFDDIATGAIGATDEVRTLTKALEEMARVVKDQAFQRGVDRVFNLRAGAGGMVGVEGAAMPGLGTEQMQRLITAHRELELASGSTATAFERLRDYLYENADLVAGIGRGFLSLADTLGILSKDSRRALSGLVDLAEGVRTLKAAQAAGGAMGALGTVAGAFGIAGGLVQLVTGMAGMFGGDDRSQERQRQIAEQQKDAVRRFDEAVKRFSEAVGGTPSSITEDYINVLGQIPFGLDWWENIMDLAEIAGERIKMVTDAYREELEVRRLVALGMDKEAATLRKQIEQRKELQAAIDAGWDEATIDLLKEVLALEWDAFVGSLKDAAEAVEDLDTAFLRNLDVRELYAKGLDREAIALQRDIEYQDMLDRGYSESTVARLRYIHGLEDEAAALAAAEAARRQSRAFDADLDLREVALYGTDRDLLTARANAELERGIQLLLDDVITFEQYMRLEAIVMAELGKALRELEDAATAAAEAARKAAQAERERARQDMQNLRVRLLMAQGDDAGARALRNQAETEKAIADGRSASYIQLLQLVHAEEARRDALNAQTKAIQDTTAAANEMARVLNAPTGLRLSLLQWRAQGSGVFPSPSADTGRPAQQTTSFTFGAESITIVAAKGESGEELLDRILAAANRRARAGAGNVFEDLSEAL